MIENNGPIRRAVVLAMMVVAASSHYLARAQFVPGRLFVGRASANLCETDKFGVPFDDEYIWELNPEDGSFKIFAIIPREFCGFITGMAMSPDGKRLRAASWLQSAIFEFDAQGNMSIALDWWDGIRGPEGSNCIAYDRLGNFYVSNFEGANVLKFPADGGAAQVIAEYDPDDPEPMYAPRALAVAKDGTVYVRTMKPDSDVFKITSDGEVSLFDFYTGFNEVIVSLTVDDFGNLFALGQDQYAGHVYRYLNGDPNSRERILSCPEDLVCGIGTLSMSEDRSLIIGRRFNEIRYIDPVAGNAKPGPTFSLGSISNYGTAIVPLRGDLDSDNIVDVEDYLILDSCFIGPSGGPLDPECDLADLDADGDIDLFDMRFFQRAFGGSR